MYITLPEFSPFPDKNQTQLGNALLLQSFQTQTEKGGKAKEDFRHNVYLWGRNFFLHQQEQMQDTGKARKATFIGRPWRKGLAGTLFASVFLDCFL